MRHGQRRWACCPITQWRNNFSVVGWLGRAHLPVKSIEQPVVNRLRSEGQCTVKKRKRGRQLRCHSDAGNVMATDFRFEAVLMPKENTENAGRLPTVRAAVTNGTRATLFADGRSAGARRYRDLTTAFGEEAGGFNRLEASGQQLIRRLAQVSVELELQEAQRADGGTIDPIAYATLTNAQARLLRELGKLKVRIADKPPTLREHLEALASARVANDDAAHREMEPA
jgi:hypothetical protein